MMTERLKCQDCGGEPAAVDLGGGLWRLDCVACGWMAYAERYSERPAPAKRVRCRRCGRRFRPKRRRWRGQ